MSIPDSVPELPTPSVLRPCEALAPYPVSYTHLDVYKRQPLMAIKLEKAFGGITAESWLAMQAKYDLWQEEQSYDDTVIPFEFA